MAAEKQTKRTGLVRLGSVALLLTVASCAYLPAPLRRAAPAATPHLVALDAGACNAVLQDDTTPASLQQAAARDIPFLEKLPVDRLLPALDRRVRVGALLAMLQALNAAPPDTWVDEICGRFRLYQVALPGAAPAASGVLFTGYYQPELTARRRRTDRFRYPLYRVPDDLVDVPLKSFCSACAGRVAEGRVVNGVLEPYYTRAEIDAGALAGHGYELAWLDDPVAAFFMHVQGSGLLRFADGVHMEVGYSGSNGRPYTSIGKLLVAEGKLAPDAVSLRTVERYLRAHPHEQRAIMEADERYIFFRTVVAGPIGSLGVPLTAGRSIAADLRVYPPGGLAFVHIASHGSPPEPAATRVARFALIQDTGAAITGADRIDVFWGTGSTAEELAGDMRNPGTLYLVLPQ